MVLVLVVLVLVVLVPVVLVPGLGIKPPDRSPPRGMRSRKKEPGHVTAKSWTKPGVVHRDN